MTDALDLARSQEHEWIEKWNLTVCKRCLMVKRADGKNAPCKGSARLRLHDGDDSITQAFISFARREAKLEAELERLSAALLTAREEAARAAMKAGVAFMDSSPVADPEGTLMAVVKAIHALKASPKDAP